ncbi:MAG: ATP-binding protein [Chloroflexota bacterium]
MRIRGLRQALQNLLWNALRYTPEGGHILLTVNQRGYVVVTVRDTGAGIAAEHLPHVFDRFYRSDPARDRESGGAGLGLAIVKATVEAHDGTVQQLPAMAWAGQHLYHYAASRCLEILLINQAAARLACFQLYWLHFAVDCPVSLQERGVTV